MDELLPYYNRELSFIRNLGAEFADAHPKIAGRLRLSRDMAEDPHVSRLIEAFALLSARTRRKIDDEFPEITEAMLGTLYPHFLAPVPSACVAQLTLDHSQTATPTAQFVRRGSEFETAPIEGEPCRFRACYPATLWPIKVAEASVHGQPLPAPATRFTPQSTAVVRVRLETLSPKVKFSDLALGSLRFYLHGQSLHSHELYERLLNNAVGVALKGVGRDAQPVLLPKERLLPVGFERSEGLLDYSPRSFLGYRLLSELFTFPEKFLFVELAGLTPEVMAQVGGGNTIEIFIYLDQASQDLERNVDAGAMRLGCTPLVNLFHNRAEPITLTNFKPEYRVAPDARRPRAHEIYSIDRVFATAPDDRQLELFPLYSMHHSDADREYPVFWHAARRSSNAAADQVDHGTELHLSLVDLDGEPARLAGWTLDVETTCTNRDLPGRLPFGGGQPDLRLSSGGVLAKVECLTPPTRSHRPALGRGVHWRLISKLTLNHLSLVDGPEGAAALREVLSLYDLASTPQSQNMIQGLTSTSSKRVVGRVGGPVSSGFCRGVEVTLLLDEERFSGGGLFLFASVLERFLGLYASINSFSRTRVLTNKRQAPLRVWPPRAGEQVLL